MTRVEKIAAAEARLAAAWNAYVASRPAAESSAQAAAVAAAKANADAAPRREWIASVAELRFLKGPDA